MLWPKKNSYKESDNEKKFLRLENSPSPAHNFSNGPFLTEVLRYSADTFSRVKARHMIWGSVQSLTKIQRTEW